MDLLSKHVGRTVGTRDRTACVGSLSSRGRFHLWTITVEKAKGRATSDWVAPDRSRPSVFMRRYSRIALSRCRRSLHAKCKGGSIRALTPPGQRQGIYGSWPARGRLKRDDE